MDGEECGICGSTEFYDEDGRIFCANGHDQGLGLATAEDDADFGRQGTVVRKKEIRKKQKISKGMSNSTEPVLRGAKAYQLFLQSWQFILWKQCYVLVHQKGLPAELWAIVRDLWALWLSKLEHRLGDSHAEAMQNADTTASSGNDTDTDLDADVRREPEGNKAAHSYPTLIDTIALNYLGIVMLRRPIGLAKVLKWILEEEVPFIRAIRYIPQDMKDRLPGEYHQALDTLRLLGPDELQKAVYHRARWYSASFGMVMPQINLNLFLLDYVRQLALPLEIYSVARGLNTIIKYEFRYADVTESSQPTRRQPTTYPESQLISLVVVATKLLFPFDSENVKRYPQDPNDPTTLNMNWPSWLEAKANFDKRTQAGEDANGFKPGSEIHVKDSDILDMTDQQLDKYMDWYQKTWITSKHTSTTDQAQEQGIEKDILDMFPLHDVPEHQKTLAENGEADQEEESWMNARIMQVQSSLKARRAITLEEESERSLDVLRPGSRYPRYPKVDDLDKAPDGAVVKMFHQEAAETACLSVKALLLAVNRTEEKIEQWLADRRREDAFGEDLEQSEDHEDKDGPDTGEDMDFIPETSPPGKLARDMEGLEIGQSPNVEDDVEGVVDTEMLLHSPHGV
ncbi:uncharacterized protein Z520_06377 [Fonsecaea multimorphosa CBS 102226]|uniref:RRN7-type domain-containing protein n=1 Tax=Fonsecaea multimorphosa CBS 102226 TaxID=1442371 RepID=A0A0D2K383_9EURO|nr:uncharacterized protein Z520_06377 [Fonsecaea multimorphosa CBS 102226]KIX97599.1 hypothetical protein Z520_06377 [Fonsecaea multimorphosa CBS 102226]